MEALEERGSRAKGSYIQEVAMLGDPNPLGPSTQLVGAVGPKHTVRRP